MRRRALAVLAALACQVLGGCAPAAAPSDEDLQSLCGPSSRLQDVESYDGSFGVPTAFVNRHRLPVGLLRWRDDLATRYFDEKGNVNGRGWCTGTLIDDDLFLTAGHCLDSEDTGTWRLPREKGNVLLRPQELAREFVVDFRYQNPDPPGGPTSQHRVEVVRLEEYREGGLDYAILRLSDHPGQRNGVARISPSDAEPGSKIAILQHPAAAPMKIAAGSALRVEGPRISYDTIDTLGGSSGAGILDAATGKLVGVHTNGGCTKSDGGENSGVTIGALISVSKLLRERVDRSRDFLVGDWDNDGLGDLAVFYNGCVYPDVNHDGVQDGKICPAYPSADQYFVGNWQPGGPSQLAWRRRNCVFLDTNPQQPLCYGDQPFELMVMDWNGDGRSDLGVRRGPCIDFDTHRDGVLDDPGYCYGNGAAEDEYLAGNWDGHRASVAVRADATLLIDVDHDGDPDDMRAFGKGGTEDQYLVGDWDGDGRAELALREGAIGWMNRDGAGALPEMRTYRDFWSER